MGNFQKIKVVVYILFICNVFIREKDSKTITTIATYLCITINLLLLIAHISMVISATKIVTLIIIIIIIVIYMYI
jgi:hypothetical protein